MLFKSMNYTLKDVFYNVEKLFSGRKSSPLEEAEHARRSAVSQRAAESSMTSGAFLSRARRGETLKPDKEENHEIVKGFVKAKASTVDEISIPVETPPAPILNMEESDEIPVFGLKASLHATTEIPSFDKWKSVHSTIDYIDESEEVVSYQSNSNTDTDEMWDLKTVPNTWRTLSSHNALRLIDHPNTSADVLMQLARHIDPEVRSQVADNPNASQDVIELLVADESIDVRLALAECYHLPSSVMQKLLEDENPYVCARAQVTIQRITASTSPSNVSVIRNLFGANASNESAEIKQLRARA